MLPYKQFDSRQLSSSQYLNYSQLRIHPNMQNQTMDKENEMYGGPGFHPDTSMQARNIPTRQMSQSRYFPQGTAPQSHSTVPGGPRHSFFLPPNPGAFVQSGQRYNSQTSMASNDPVLSAPANVGYSRVATHHMSATPIMETQSVQWHDEQYPRNILTENTQMMNVPNYSQRQPPSFEASGSQKMTVGSSSMSLNKMATADYMSKTVTKFTPSTSLVPSEKKRSIDQDTYEQFNMIGSVEQVICWNQMAKGRKCSINYELHGFLESVTEESPSVSILWIKQDPQNGPVIQGVFCNIDRRLTDKLQPGNYIVCYGRMLKAKIMQVFNAVVDNTLDVGIKRISFLCQRSLQEFINSPSSSNRKI